MAKKVNTKTHAKSKNLPLIAGTLLLVCAAAVIVWMNSGNGKTAANSDAQSISEGESLIIATADITESASFYPIEVDGVEMEVLAVKDSEGNIRTAFNTCQTCYHSGHGYYVQEGSDLVCQNCGYHFTPDQVEVVSGGCNPWPIFPENKTQTADTIEISYSFLKESTVIFGAWRS